MVGGTTEGCRGEDQGILGQEKCRQKELNTRAKTRGRSFFFPAIGHHGRSRMKHAEIAA
jgi:hypothetical protein